MMGNVLMELFPSKGAVVFLLPVFMGHLFTSTAVGLQVAVTPGVIQQYQGTSIEIQCAVRNIAGNARLVPYWFHNFAPNMNRIVAVSTLTKYPYRERSSIAAYYYIGGLDYILRIRNLMPEDAGTYICSIHYDDGIEGTFQQSATVTVLEPPSLPSCFPNGSVFIMEGSMLVMSCSSDAVNSPNDLSVQWQPPTGNPQIGPPDSDWTVVAHEDQPVQKQLTVVSNAGYNNSWFVCSAAREDESLSVIVFESCTIGPITIIPTPPQMTISVTVLHPQFPLLDGNAAHFACEVNLTGTPIVLGTTLESSWDISPKIDTVRVFHSSLPGSRSIVIKISHQDNGAVISCVATYKGETYRDNVTLVVSPIASTEPGLSTVASQSATSNAYPTAATNATLTEGPTTPQNQPWYSKPSVIVPIALSAALLVFFIVILVSCLITRRRKPKREREQEEAELEQLSRYPPLALHTRPTSENIYHELSDQNRLPDEAQETQESTSPGAEQPYSECTSPLPELEVYAETVENILYVPSVDNPTGAADGAVGPALVGNYEVATFGSAGHSEGTYTYAAVI